MKNLFYLLFFFLISYAQIGFGETNASLNPGVDYKLLKKNHHNIHVLNIDPKYFILDIVKARNQTIGRETVESIALRKNAVAAINAGFFEIGNSEDGRPSLTLVVDGKIFSLSHKHQGLLVIDRKQVSVIEAVPEISAQTPQGEFLIPSHVNSILKPSAITLYNDAWGKTTLTPYSTKEIIINNEHKVIDLSTHGDNTIPQGGFVLSFPNGKILPKIKKGDSLKITLEFVSEDEKIIKVEAASSVVTAIPILVKDGLNIQNEISASSSVFKKNPHARTAIGLKADGTIVMVVVEHAYKQSIKDLKLQQVRELLSQEANIDMKTLTIPQAMTILEKRFTHQETVGLTIAELGDLMVDLGCVTAVNLDGGGSSTMFVGDKVVCEATMSASIVKKDL